MTSEKIKFSVSRLPEIIRNFVLAWLVVFADFGVKLVSNLEKVKILDNIEACKPLILAGLQKNSKNISTHLLTVLIISVILQLEQRKRFQ